MFLYTGPHPKRRGARRQYAGKVNCQALSRFEALAPREDEPHLPLYTAVVWHKTLKRRLRLVGLLNRQAPAKPRFIVLGSTDPELNGHKLIALYAARFQIEFLFRDSQQFTGLLDCQARAAAALDFPCNASLATLTLVRAEDLGGIRLTRDSWVSVMYAEALNSAKSSVTLQSTDRHGILGQKSADFQVSL